MERLLSRAGRPVRDAAWLALGLLFGIGIAALRADDKPRLSFEPARAVTLDLGAGACAGRPKSEGTWWTDVGGTSVSASPKTSACGQLGLSHVYSNGLGWRASYVDMGRMPLREDAWSNYGPQPHWTATGFGRTQGVTLGTVGELRLLAALRATGEAGAFLYRTYWQAHVEHHASGAAGGIATQPRIGATWYAGAGLAYALTPRLDLTVNLRRYADIRANTAAPNSDVIGPERMSVVTGMLGFSYRFGG